MEIQKTILQSIQVFILLGIMTSLISSSTKTLAQEFSSEITPSKDYFSDLTLNPTNRIDILKTQLYPELFPKVAPQTTADTYRLPLSAPSTTYVTQTYFGPYSHQTTKAIDFFGTNLKVAIARSGVVITK